MICEKSVQTGDFSYVWALFDALMRKIKRMYAI